MDTLSDLKSLAKMLAVGIVACAVPALTSADAAQPNPSARMATTAKDLLEGPLARGMPGDIVMENELFRIIIQRPGRFFADYNSSLGGVIIDAAAKRANGRFHPDHLGKIFTYINFENSVHYTKVDIVKDGSDGEAVVCVGGPDDLLDILNPTSAVDLHPLVKELVDDRDLPVEVETCYTLLPGKRYVTIDTRLTNTSAAPEAVYLGEYLISSGQVETYQQWSGLGQPEVQPSCATTVDLLFDGMLDGFPDQDVFCLATGAACEPCNYIAFTGVDGATGVSYGLIHDAPGTSSTLAQSRVLILGYRTELLLLVGLGLPIPPGDVILPGDEFSITRYFAVGDGSASSIADIRNEILSLPFATLNGRVSSGGRPVKGADIAVYQPLHPSLPIFYVAGHARTDSNGDYHLTLVTSPVGGTYFVSANKEGFLSDAANHPAVHLLTNGDVETRDFDLPEPGYLRVHVRDQHGSIPAKVQVLGADPSPPEINLNPITEISSGLFGELNQDPTLDGVTRVDYIGKSGVGKPMALEPGSYHLLISHGPRYSVFSRDIEINSGHTTVVMAQIAKVIDHDGFVHSDFHVHSIDSVDSKVAREDRVESFLADGVDFFTPSDHDVRVDFSETVQQMGVSKLIAVTTNCEVTTFDYGHFNAWPVTVDPDDVGGGAIDHGGAAPLGPGFDFPEYDSYNLLPADIFDLMRTDPMESVVQINHVDTLFGRGGLQIDTRAPGGPRSEGDLEEKRLDPTTPNAFDDDFDTLELMGGGSPAWVETFMMENAGDWFNLLNQGIVRFGVSNSDTHGLRSPIVDMRNLVAGDIRLRNNGLSSKLAAQIADSVRSGKTVGTNLATVSVEADGVFASRRQHAGLHLEDKTTMPIDSGSDVIVTVRISHPDWADVDTVEFYINSMTDQYDDGGATRYAVCPDRSITVDDGPPAWKETSRNVAPSISGGTRTDIVATLELEQVEEDTWVVVVARGSDEVDDLYPLFVPGTRPFSFSNPLFIDVDGDGWKPPAVIREKDCL